MNYSPNADAAEYDGKCCRCNDDENGGYSLPDGSFVCENCLTETEKTELADYWSNLSK